MIQGILIAVILVSVAKAYDKDGKYAYQSVSFIVFDPNGKGQWFDLNKSTDGIKELALNKGKKYRWLIHDCMSKPTQMQELAQVFRENFPDDNVILVDWSKLRNSDVPEAQYVIYRDHLEYASCSVLFAIYLIHAALYDSQSPSVRENSHIIGFGYGAVIAAHAGWLANRKDKHRVEWKYEDKYTITNFVINRVTVINPIEYCNIPGDVKTYVQCQKMKGQGPDYPMLLITQDCATFLDGYYSTFRTSHYTLCPRETKDNRRGLQHHRGVHFVDNNLDDQKVGGCPKHELYHFHKHCSELATLCVHQVALSLYTDAMRLLNRTIPSDCNSMVFRAFGETDPNKPGETLAVNVHIQSESADVLKGEYGCEIAQTEFPKLKAKRLKEHCEANEMMLEADQTWNFNKY